MYFLEIRNRLFKGSTPSPQLQSYKYFREAHTPSTSGGNVWNANACVGYSVNGSHAITENCVWGNLIGESVLSRDENDPLQPRHNVFWLTFAGEQHALILSQLSSAVLLPVPAPRLYLISTPLHQKTSHRIYTHYSKWERVHDMMHKWVHQQIESRLVCDTHTNI